jgi:hypothetical protein
MGAVVMIDLVEVCVPANRGGKADLGLPDSNMAELLRATRPVRQLRA